MKIAVGLGSRRSRSGNEGLERHYCSQMPPRVSLAFDAKPRHQRYSLLHTHICGLKRHISVSNCSFTCMITPDSVSVLTVDACAAYERGHDVSQKCVFCEAVLFGLAQRAAVSREKCVYESSLNFLRSYNCAGISHTKTKQWKIFTVLSVWLDIGKKHLK